MYVSIYGYAMTIIQWLSPWLYMADREVVGEPLWNVFKYNWIIDSLDAKKPVSI